MALFSSRHWRVFVLTAFITTVIASSFAVADHERSVRLRSGESYTVQDRFGSLTVQCGSPGAGYPGGPGHGYPGNPSPGYPSYPGQPSYPGNPVPVPGFPGGPGPGFPGGPSCSTVPFDANLQRLVIRRDRLAQGQCGYRRADGFMRCEGLLDRYEVQSQKDAFNRDLNDLKLGLESLCRTRGCPQIDISRMSRDYDALLGSLQFNRIVFEGYQSVPFIDFPQNFRLNCSSW